MCPVFGACTNLSFNRDVSRSTPVNRHNDDVVTAGYASDLAAVPTPVVSQLENQRLAIEQLQLIRFTILAIDRQAACQGRETVLAVHHYQRFVIMPHFHDTAFFHR